MKKITVVIPCYNEEKGIGKVIESVPNRKLKELGYTVEVLVIDNNSSDKTSQIAKKLGAKVIFEPNPGKGNAIRTGFRHISEDTDFVVMLDGDDTYKAKEIPRMVEPLENDFCDVIVGSRLEGRMNGNAMSFSHRTANWFFTFITRYFYGANVTDTCTGYFAWKKKAIVKLNGYLKSSGFAIEAEMITKMAKLGNKIYSVPITYDPRHGESNSKLSPIGDGLKITWMLFKNIGWKPGK
ncbi:MAG: glycosyltransferase family 2 protein [Nanoarchaeota archaeon]